MQKKAKFKSTNNTRNKNQELKSNKWHNFKIKQETHMTKTRIMTVRSYKNWEVGLAVLPGWAVFGLYSDLVVQIFAFVKLMALMKFKIV